MTAATPKVSDIFEQKYELLELLGAGGIGTVFQARQLDSGRLVALKILHPQFAEDQEFKQRFWREAQVLNKLNHAHIVTVYHLGLSQDGIPYLAMEFIEGVTLRKVLAAGKLDPARAIAITRQLCQALAFMHEQGIVHRDLKPENLVLMQQPEPDYLKIIDFGLVRIESTDDQHLTSTGMLIGSASYMSPEQCRGNKADLRSDIYSTAVCFYEMLSGKCPFIADSFVGLIYKHANSEPPLISFSDIKPFHPSINEFLKKGLQKDPALRFQNAMEMDAALEQLNASLSSSSGIWASWPQSRFAPAILALCLVASAAAALYLVSSNKSQLESKVEIRRIENTRSRHKIKSTHELRDIYTDELMQVAQDPANGYLIRCSAYLEFAWSKRREASGLTAARQAKQLYLEKRLGGRGLGAKINLIEDEALVCNGKFQEALPDLEESALDAKDNLNVQYRLRAVALSALASASLGKTDKATQYLKQLASWEYGLDYPATAYALQSALLLKRMDFVPKIIGKATRIGHAADMARTLRYKGFPELADLCIEHGLKLVEPQNPLTKTDNSPLSEADISFAIEQSWSNTHQHKVKQAAETLLAICRKPGFDSVLIKTGYTSELARALRNAGLTDKALEIEQLSASKTAKSS